MATKWTIICGWHLDIQAKRPTKEVCKCRRLKEVDINDRPTRFSIFGHQHFQSLGDLMNALRRRKLQAVGKFSLGCQAPGLRLLDQDLTQATL